MKFSATGAMKSTSAYRLVLPLGLLLLVLCSTGLALQCLKCDWTNKECKITQDCDTAMNTCMRVTRDNGESLYQCSAYNRCNSQTVSADFSLTGNINLKCCQTNLCNKGFTGLPASGLILLLAAALLVFFS